MRVLAAREFEFGHRDEHIRAAFKILGLKQSLLFLGAERAHHRQRIDERLIRRLVNALPVELQIVCLCEAAQGAQQSVAIDKILAGARAEVDGEG